MIVVQHTSKNKVASRLGKVRIEVGATVTVDETKFKFGELKRLNSDIRNGYLRILTSAVGATPRPLANPEELVESQDQSIEVPPAPAEETDAAPQAESENSADTELENEVQEPVVEPEVTQEETLEVTQEVTPEVEVEGETVPEKPKRKRKTTEV